MRAKGVGMRRFLLAAYVALGCLVVATSVFAATEQEIQAALSASTNLGATLAQYAGDPNLSAAVAAVVEGNPALAAAYVAAADSVTGANATAVQQAVGTGLANAASAFAAQGGASGDANTQTVIAAIDSSNNANLIASAAASISPTAGGLAGGTNTALGFALANNSITVNNTTSCVSPSRPGPC